MTHADLPLPKRYARHGGRSPATTVVPNVVIAGARKCGTTSVFDWLCDHPSVCASSVKEMGVLMDPGSPYFDSEARIQIHGQDAYRIFYEHSGDEPFLLKVGSRYFYQDTARRALSGRNRQPYVGFILRNPTERLYLVFRYARNNRSGLRSDVSFSAFIDATRAERVDELFHFRGESLGATDCTTR